MNHYNTTRDMTFPQKVALYFIASIGPFWLFATLIALVVLYVIAAFDLWGAGANRVFLAVTFWGGLMASCVSFAVQTPRDWLSILAAAAIWNVLIFGPIVWRMA